MIFTGKLTDKLPV